MRDPSKIYPSDITFSLDNVQEIYDHFFESLRKKNIRIDNIDLANQWIVQRIRKYRAVVKPKMTIKATYISNILTREFQIEKRWP